MSSSAIAKIRQRMGQKPTASTITMEPTTTPPAGKAIMSKSVKAKENDSKAENKKIKKPKFKLNNMLNHHNQFSAKDAIIASKKKSDGAPDEEKKTPVVEQQRVRNHGATADFAMKETLDKIYAKIESAKQKQTEMGLRKKEIKEFEPAEQIKEEPEDQESEEEFARFRKPVSGRTSRSVKGKKLENTTPTQVNLEQSEEEFELEYTPQASGNKSSSRSKKTRMGSTDGQGNRQSNMPGEGRPSLTSVTPYDDDPEQLIRKVEKVVQETQKPFVNALDRLKGDNADLMQTKRVLKNGGQQFDRENFVKTNLLKTGKYKPALRGAAFTNKVMSKKSNVFKARRRFTQKMLEQKGQVNAYGGLGANGLDFGDAELISQDQAHKELHEAFSTAAVPVKPVVKTLKLNDIVEEILEQEDEKDENLIENLATIDEVLKCPSKLQSDETDPDDLAPFQISDDAGYLSVLQEKFGHEEFRDGQLKAVKILLEEHKNSLVVLATGGGKSLCYQFATQFLPGLILVVTPLISLMTDQLQKLPDFIPGAALNSQQSYSTKQAVIRAVRDKKIKVLFITPERLFMEDLAKFGRKISMICVDEIHCASEWSHNFRPAYLVLHEMIKEKLGEECRVIGLTATATKAAQQQICEIFDIKYPDHIVTQNDLSRLNLQLSITRDGEKTTALLKILRSESYRGLTSVLIFATQRRTTDQLSDLLNQNGIKSGSYHAGKSDAARQFIQKEFIENRIRVLCCTIAFSMGIDKSDIQSVLHYDMPRSIENYVQEIGRAGRDGTLARCHMFLSNDDFYQLRRITLSDLLDHQSAVRLTNIVALEAKKVLYTALFPEVEVVKKRKRKHITQEESDEDEENHEQILDVFEHENLIKTHYQEENSSGITFINLKEIEEIGTKKMYVALNVKELLKTLDLKKEVVLTMLNQMEKLPEGKAFFRIDSVLPSSVQMRFHSKSLDELAEGSEFYRAFLDHATSRQGIYRCDVVKLAQALGVKPMSIPRTLYQIQHNSKDDMAYDLDHEAFILELFKIPSQVNIFQLAQDMLEETRKIEQNMVSKLNCMYFAARKVSMPSVDYIMRKELEDGEATQEMYIDNSHKLNELINKYFRAARGEDIEIKIAGNEAERACMMPLLYVEDEHTKKIIQKDVLDVLESFHRNEKASHCLNPANRMKPLDVLKVLMGIMSSREAVSRFKWDGVFWAKLNEYDYGQLFEICEEEVNSFYISAIQNYQDKKEADQLLKDKFLKRKKYD